MTTTRKLLTIGLGLAAVWLLASAAFQGYMGLRHAAMAHELDTAHITTTGRTGPAAIAGVDMYELMDLTEAAAGRPLTAEERAYMYSHLPTARAGVAEFQREARDVRYQGTSLWGALGLLLAGGAWGVYRTGRQQAPPPPPQGPGTPPRRMSAEERQERLDAYADAVLR